MRDYLNGVLQFIGAESLTDDEFSSITLEDTDDQVKNYEALLVILEARDLVSEMRARLQYYYLAKGVHVVLPPVAVSNIFVGALI